MESEFYNHYVAHAPLEPYAVLFHVEEDKATVSASAQAPFRVQATAADTLGIPEEHVHAKILARAAGMDPLSFRLQNLTDERMILLLNEVADKAGHSFTSLPGIPPEWDTASRVRIT